MPLTFDMPLEELQHYQGVNPRPDDFDRYWDRALQDMNTLSMDVALEDADFQASFAACHHLTFTGMGGARIHAKLVKPRKIDPPAPAVLCFHGYGISSGDWFSYLPFAAQGLVVAALDCRGQGGLSEDVGGVSGWTQTGHIVRGLSGDPEDLLYRSIFLDTAQLAKIVMATEEVDARRVGVLGGSQGGGLALACAGLVPEVKRAAVCYPFLTDYKRVWDIDQDVDAYEELRTWFRRFDPRHEREDEVFTRLGYIDVQNLAPRIQAEVLMAVGLRDTICPPSTQFAAYNKITAPKRVLLYPDYGHESEIPGLQDHFFGFLSEM